MRMGNTEGERAVEALVDNVLKTRFEDIANMAVFLSSDAAIDITGQTFFVDGGSYMA
jgi:enoyl-[acyl-carrier-protein] reductase (NADH)